MRSGFPLTTETTKQLFSWPKLLDSQVLECVHFSGFRLSKLKQFLLVFPSRFVFPGSAQSQFWMHFALPFRKCEWRFSFQFITQTKHVENLLNSPKTFYTNGCNYPEHMCKIFSCQCYQNVRKKIGVVTSEVTLFHQIFPKFFSILSIFTEVSSVFF